MPVVHDPPLTTRQVRQQVSALLPGARRLPILLLGPLALLLAGHLTRDLFGKCIGWREFEFVFNDLSARDEETELAVQVQLLQAGVLTVNEVRAMRGLGPLTPAGVEQLAGEAEPTSQDSVVRVGR